jgi:polysaccharide export outer membrane protein
MKLYVRGFFLSICIVAGMLLAGCGTTSQDTSANGTKHPAQTSPPSEIARFAIGDTVIVSFSGLPSGDPMMTELHQEPIKDDGTITLPYIDSVVAPGTTAGELQTEIHYLYVPKYYFNLTVTVSPGERVYYVGGEVKEPGRQEYVDATTLTKAIQSAGGLTDFASHHNVKLTHSATGQVITVDYDAVLQNPAEDPPVYPNDQINVEKRIW